MNKPKNKFDSIGSATPIKIMIKNNIFLRSIRLFVSILNKYLSSYEVYQYLKHKNHSAKLKQVLPTHAIQLVPIN